MRTIVKRSGVTVAVYESRFRGRPRWEVRWHWGGQVHRASRGAKNAALVLAGIMATRIANGETARYRLTDAQAYEMERACELLAPLGKTPLQVAYEELARAAAATALPAGPMVSEVVACYLSAKAAQEVSPLHARDLSQRLNRFADSFRCPVGRLSGLAIGQWLDGLNVGPRSWNNYRQAVAGLLDYARKTKAFSPGAGILEALEARKLPRAGRPQVFSPQVMALLLGASSDRLLPALALGAFAGVRSQEVLRLDWSAFNWPESTVLLHGSVTKTKRTRAVPLAPNLVEWLGPWAHLHRGMVCSFRHERSLANAKMALAQKVGMVWSRNALRKSFISYRLALVRSVDAVALEAGNSAGQIHAHYLDLVSPGAALAWFDLRPANSTALLPLQFG